MDATETKLADWATKHGVNYGLVRTQMLPGDVETVAKQLRYARENNAPEETRCVLFWMRLLESRVATVVKAAA